MDDFSVFLSADAVQDPREDRGGWEDLTKQTCSVISDDVCWSLITSILWARKVNKWSNQHAPLKTERWQTPCFSCLVIPRFVLLESGGYTLITHFILLSSETFFSYLLDFDVWYNFFVKSWRGLQQLSLTCFSLFMPLSLPQLWAEEQTQFDQQNHFKGIYANLSQTSTWTRFEPISFWCLKLTGLMFVPFSSILLCQKCLQGILLHGTQTSTFTQV